MKVISPEIRIDFSVQLRLKTLNRPGMFWEVDIRKVKISLPSVHEGASMVESACLSSKIWEIGYTLIAARLPIKTSKFVSYVIAAAGPS